MRIGHALSVTALSLLIAAAALAQTYRAIPGRQEFSGQLLVRPKQPDQILRENPSLMSDTRRVSLLESIPDRAVRRIRGNIVRYMPKVDLYVVRVPRGFNENRYIRELMRSGDYEYAVPNFRMAYTQRPNDPRFGEQWHHQAVQSELAWSIWTGDSSFITSYVDSGVRKSHEDLSASLLPGFNSADRLTEAQGGVVEDIDGHGTHVMGCGSAIGNNGRGVSGAGWNFSILPVRASNFLGGALISDALAGAEWAVDNGAKAIGVSIGGVELPAIGTMGTYVKSQGGLLFWAGGNFNENWDFFNYPDTVVVGATDEGRVLADFTATGNGVNIYAPGDEILSTTMDGAYANLSGTSMATPLAVGVTSLAWSINPDLSPDEIQEIIFSTATPINDARVRNFGEINSFEALMAANTAVPVVASCTNVGTSFGTHVSGGVPEVVSESHSDSFVIRAARQGNTGSVTGSDFRLRIPDFAGGQFGDGSTLTRVTVDLDVRASAFPVTGMLFAQAANGRWRMLKAKSLSSTTFPTWSVRLPIDQGFVSNDGTINLRLRTVAPQRLGMRDYTVSVAHIAASIGKRRPRPN